MPPVVPFRLPVKGTVRRQLAAPAEVVGLSGDEVHRPAAARVKMSGVGLAVGVDGHQHPLALRRPLENALAVGQHHIAVAAIAQGGAFSVGIGQLCDIVRQLHPFRRFYLRPQGRVGVAALDARHAPLAAVIDGGHAGHPEQQGVGQGQVGGIR